MLVHLSWITIFFSGRPAIESLQAHKSPRKVIDPHLTPNKNMTAHCFYNYPLIYSHIDVVAWLTN